MRGRGSNANSPRPERPSLAITLAQGIPKGQKMDFVVEKATELGVARVVPFASARSAGDFARAGKVERWRRIAKTAAQQCGRPDVPEVTAPVDFAGLVASFAAYERTLVPWELANRRAAARDVAAAARGRRGRCSIAIGPEGGLSRAEAEAAAEAGARPHFARTPHLAHRDGRPRRVHGRARRERRCVRA